VIERINQEFVATWIIVDDAEKLAAAGDPLAKTLAANWEYPLDLMFVAPDGRLISKLNSFADLRGVHPDVGHPPESRGQAPPHVDVFMKHVDRLLAAGE
jgi:hypothetical protein